MHLCYLVRLSALTCCKATQHDNIMSECTGSHLQTISSVFSKCREREMYVPPMHVTGCSTEEKLRNAAGHLRTLKKKPNINIECLDHAGNAHSSSTSLGKIPQDLAALHRHQGASASHIGCLEHGTKYPCPCTKESSHNVSRGIGHSL